MVSTPILYSFRRCPYAMRARYALVLKNIQCELREVDLKNKPQALLDISPKGTVPVLVLPEKLLEESLDIVAHAFGKEVLTPLVRMNDDVFAKALHRYKYYDRYPEHSQQEYRDACGTSFLDEVEKRLSESAFLLGNNLSAKDVALFPHIRQFSLVDAEWFAESHYVNLKRWLQHFYDSSTYEVIMQKHEPWQEGDTPVFLI